MKTVQTAAEFREWLEHFFYKGSFPWEKAYINWQRKREGKRPFR
jgi:hypothetical protein